MIDVRNRLEIVFTIFEYFFQTFNLKFSSKICDSWDLYELLSWQKTLVSVDSQIFRKRHKSQSSEWSKDLESVFPVRRSDNASRNVIFRYLAHTVLGNCDFYNNSFVSTFTRIRWRKASKNGGLWDSFKKRRSLRFGDLTTCREMCFFDMWHIYYSRIVTFIIVRPLVILQESVDVRLQKTAIRWLSTGRPPFLEAWRSLRTGDRFPWAIYLHEFSS